MHQCLRVLSLHPLIFSISSKSSIVHNEKQKSVFRNDNRSEILRAYDVQSLDIQYNIWKHNLHIFLCIQ